MTSEAIKIKIYTQEGKEAGEITLPAKVFGLPWNADLVHQVTVAHQANQRENIAHTKMRGEVSGGGKKPWRQKGTGRARHGSIRSPIWKGGGVTHGPRSERNYTQKINKKMNRKAILTVLSRKMKENELLVLEGLVIEAPKTKFMHQVLKHLPLKRLNAVVGLPQAKGDIMRASKNLPNIKVMPATNFNVVDLLKYKYIILPHEAVSVIEKTFAK